MASLRVTASLFVLAALAAAPVSSQVRSVGPLELAGPAAPLAPAANQVSDLVSIAEFAPRGLALGLAATASASKTSFDWLARKTPLGGADFSPLIAAAALYQKGDVAGGDAIAAKISDPLQRLTLEWIALRDAPREASLIRIDAFLEAHPNWPSRDFLTAFREALLYGQRGRPDFVRAAFAATPPTTPAGALALASAERETGHVDKATEIVRALWRERDLDGWLESEVLRDFAPLLTVADHRARALRLLYAEKYAAASRAAALAGADAPLFANSWIAAAHGALAEQAYNALPAAVKSAPGLLYARIQGLRRADRVLEAALLIRSAPHNAEAAAGDRWWDERRMVARRLLDGGLAKDAYRLCADNAASSAVAKIDAEFHAGWIALRFLEDPKIASRHFASVAAIAAIVGSPLAAARAAYWQGRTAEQAVHPEEAKAFYQHASSFSIAYYGQLSAERLDQPTPLLRQPAPAARALARNEATQVAELLYDVKLDGLARSLAFDAARSYMDEAQLAALANVVAYRADASALVEIGKQATLRGFSLDEAAFPTFGMPPFEPLAGSAELPLVYSVARQESEFAAAAASGVGAKGLMQLMPATAKETARRAGVAYDPNRLIADPSFNTQLGAAFLGQLFADEEGSAILAFAAYNAGGGRVQQWIDAYGDPRLPNVDPVDWVERIPFDETRDYVQRVMENWRVYRVRFGENAPTKAAAGRVANAD